MIDIEIQTYWNVETLYYVFNAVASIMAGAGFEGLMKMVFLFAIGIGMFAYAGNKQLEMAKWFIQALVFVSILNLPIARVGLTDKTGLEPPRVVDNVPFALAIVGQTTNLAFGFLTRTYETVFGVPEELGLQKGDVGFGHRILKNVNNATVRDPQLRSDLMQFIKECTIYDIKDGVISAQEIVGGTDTWNTIFTNTSPARFVTYDTLTPEPQTAPCTDAAQVLKDRVADAVSKAQTFYGKQAFSRASTDAIAESMFVSAIGTSYDWILNNSSNASTALRQSMFNNIWKEAGAELPALLNDPARVAEVNAMMASAQAARQAAGANASISILAQETIPHMRNWLEAILYAMFPIIVVIMVMVSAQGSKQVLGGYMMSLAWIGMWPVLFAVINHLSMMHLRYKMRALELAAGAGIPFQLSDVFDATLTDEQSMIGYMVIFVPFLSAAIIKMGQGGFMSIADKMTASFSGLASQLGGQAASGNHSSGQVGMDTASVNTTSMHKYDSNMALSGGGAMIGTGSGGMATMAPNGAVAMSQLHNRMLQQMGMDHRYEAGRNQEAHRTDISSAGDQLSYRHGDTSTGNNVVGSDRTRGAYQQSGVAASTSEQGGYGGAHTGGQSLGKTYRDNANFHMQAGANDNLGMNLGVGRPSGAAPAVGAGATGPVDSRGAEKRIENGIRGGGGTEAQVNQAKGKFRAANAGGTSPGGLVSRISAGLGLQSNKTYGAAQGRDRSVADQHSHDESARTERTFQVSGQRATQNSSGAQSQQTSRTGNDAVLSNIDERSQISDVSDRTEYGTGDRANRSESNSFTQHRDLMADPSFMAAVAARNGMSATRFYSQETPTIMSMVQDYAAEKGMVNAAQTLNTNTFAGETLPANKTGLQGISEKERKEIPNDIRAKHKRKAAATGAGSTAPVRTNTSTPGIVGQSRGAVEGQLDPKNKGSIPARTGALDDNVHAWASPDKKVGEGRANPMGVVEDMEGRDIKDSALKAWDKLTGGDGTADGEKLSDNMKRETSASPSINSGTKR